MWVVIFVGFVICCIFFDVVFRIAQWGVDGHMGSLLVRTYSSSFFLNYSGSELAVCLSFLVDVFIILSFWIWSSELPTHHQHDRPPCLVSGSCVVVATRVVLAVSFRFLYF